MISGAHSVIFSKDPEADRAFFRDVLKLPDVDVGGGWLIFGLPPSEVAVHPSDKNNVHEFYLMCDNLDEFINAMQKHDIACSDIENQPWGCLINITLPGGGNVGIYEPSHQRPDAP